MFTVLCSFSLSLSLSSCYKSQEIIISKTDGERLGIHIKGGLNGQRGNPVDPTDEGVFVSKINSVGAARRDGRLKVSNYLTYIYLQKHTHTFLFKHV